MEWESWFENKNFTTDWSSSHFANWERHLEALRDRAASVLEIGSWEGRSAVFFLEFLPKCRITCIDTFEGGSEYARYEAAVVRTVETRFDSNLAPYGQRIRKMKSRSVPALDRLAQENARFDLIYIDGSHVRDDVLVDSLIAWPLLLSGGICIWDDYAWGLREVPSAQRPQDAVDAFLTMHADELQVLHRAAQVIVGKRPGGTAQGADRFTFPRTAANLIRFLRRQPLDP